MISLLMPLLRAAHGLDLCDPEQARAELWARLPPHGEEGLALSRELGRAVAEGRVSLRGEAPLRFTRLAKASPETLGFSIDLVHMEGKGPRHRHAKGEVNWCIGLEGSPLFDGQAPGWVVFPPGSTHVPTVSGGTMLIIYLLPDGAIEFLA